MHSPCFDKPVLAHGGEAGGGVCFFVPDQDELADPVQHLVLDAVSESSFRAVHLTKYMLSLKGRINHFIPEQNFYLIGNKTLFRKNCCWKTARLNCNAHFWCSVLEPTNRANKSVGVGGNWTLIRRGLQRCFVCLYCLAMSDRTCVHAEYKV